MNQKVTDALLKPLNPSLIILLGVFTIMWGLWLVAPWWDVLSSADAFQFMDNVGPETVWGIVAIVTGIFTVRGAVSLKVKSLLSGSLVSALHWLMIAILCFLGDWQNTAWLTYFTIATYAAIVYMNIRVNTKYYKKELCDSI